MNFGQAQEVLESGGRVARAGWNGKNMWLTKIASWSAGTQCGPMPSDWEGYVPFYAMYTADKKLVPWLASQTDLRATDWETVEVPL